MGIYLDRPRPCNSSVLKVLDDSNLVVPRFQEEVMTNSGWAQPVQ